MTQTTTPRTERTTKTAMMTMTRIKRRHPRLVLAAGLSPRKRQRKNDRLLARKRSPGLSLSQKNDHGPSRKRNHVRERGADLGKRNALDPAPRSVRVQNPRNVKGLDQNLDLGKRNALDPAPR